MQAQKQNITHTSLGDQRQTAPILKVKDWMIILLLLAIPIVNIIMLFVWAFGDNENPNKTNYAKAALLWMLIIIGFYVFLTVASFVVGIIIGL